MRKIPTLFARDEDTNRRYVKNEVVPEAKWVLDGEGVATRKFDGTCVLLRSDSEVFVRREVKANATPPPDFMRIESDPVTGKTVGWEPAGASGFAKYITEALGDREWAPSTYELCGPKVNGNPEDFDCHVLVRHGREKLTGVPRDFDGLAKWLSGSHFEGIVWHHPDGRMAKLKRRDFPKS